MADDGGMGVAAMLFVGFVGFAFVAILAFGIVATIKRNQALRARGLSPFTADIELAAQVAGSRAFAPQRSTEQRLTELDDLLARGVISSDEHAAARLEVLSEP